MLKQLKFNDIKEFEPINNVDDQLVSSLAVSMMENGWIGAPILIYDGRLLTGSHRLVALKYIYATHPEAKILDESVALDVTEIVMRRIEELSDEFFQYDIDYSSLGEIFEGTEIEKWKDQIKEW